jgi:hypothetical protein
MVLLQSEVVMIRDINKPESKRLQWPFVYSEAKNQFNCLSNSRAHICTRYSINQ